VPLSVAVRYAAIRGSGAPPASPAAAPVNPSFGIRRGRRSRRAQYYLAPPARVPPSRARTIRACACCARSTRRRPACTQLSSVTPPRTLLACVSQVRVCLCCVLRGCACLRCVVLVCGRGHFAQASRLPLSLTLRHRPQPVVSTCSYTLRSPHASCFSHAFLLLSRFCQSCILSPCPLARQLVPSPSPVALVASRTVSGPDCPYASVVTRRTGYCL
jgi:hypothetical protein